MSGMERWMGGPQAEVQRLKAGKSLVSKSYKERDVAKGEQAGNGTR